MANIIQTRSINSTHLERWLTSDRIEQLAGYMTKGGGPNNPWYGPDIVLQDVPGSVWVTKDGDFRGSFKRGLFASAADHFADHLKGLWKHAGKPIYMQEPELGVGFTSISNALAQASAGGTQRLNGTILKNGPTGVVGATSSLWRLGAAPIAGAVGAAVPAGNGYNHANTGAMGFANTASGTLHLTGADLTASVINNSIMLYDRLFGVAPNMANLNGQLVTGTPQRYQSSSPTAQDYAGGNFLIIFAGGTQLAATAHNWTPCQYTDEAGNATQTLPSVTGISGCIIDRADIPVSTWFCPLATGDVGLLNISRIQCSASVATGVIEFVIGHPLGIMSFPVINSMLPYDWLTNREQAPRIFNDACLALLELPKPATTATVYSGLIYATSAA